MTEEINPVVIGSLIGSIGATAGALIGSIIAPRLNHNYRMQQLEKEHEKKIDYMQKELILKEKIETFKKIHQIIYEIKRKTINFLIKREKDDTPITELIFELNNEFFLFSDKNTLTEVKESVQSMQNVLENPPSIITIKDKKVEIDQKELEKTVKLISDAQAKILISLRKELKL